MLERLTARLAITSLGLIFLLIAGCGEDGVSDPSGADPPAPPTLYAEPAFSPGESNTITWSAGESPNKMDFTGDTYLVQRARNAEFSLDLEQSDWIDVENYTFADLGDGVTYHYRVKARGVAGLESAFSSPVSSTQDATPPTSAVEPLEPDQLSLTFDVAFQADDTTSGVAEVELWYRPEGGDWTSFGRFAQNPIRFVAPTGDIQYQFRSVAYDLAGLGEEKDIAIESTTQVPAQIIITDNSGKEWDITSAVLKYNMSMSGWGNGLGPDVIRPIVDPEMLCPGDPTYPDSNQIFVVLGVELAGHARAYRLNDLFDTEVVDDTLGDAHIAVTY